MAERFKNDNGFKPHYYNINNSSSICDLFRRSHEQFKTVHVWAIFKFESPTQKTPKKFEELRIFK